MKKSYTLLLIMLVSLSGFLYAKKKAGPIPVKSDTLSLQLMPSLEHDIKVTYIQKMNLLFFLDSVTILKADLIKDGMRSFFLNKAFKISRVTINDTEVKVTEYAHLDANNFVPRIRMQAIEDINDNCLMMEFNPTDLDLRVMPDTIVVKIKYDLKIEGEMPSLVLSPGRLDIPGDCFWYPRNLNKREYLQLELRSNDLATYEINNQEIKYVQNGFLRQADINYIDSPDRPLTFSLISSGLK